MYGAWNQVGITTDQNENHSYEMPVKEGCRITERLGAIQIRDDKRWNWWRWDSDFHGDWRGIAQGVSESKDEAKERVEEGWPISSGEVLDQMIQAVAEIAKRHGPHLSPGVRARIYIAIESNWLGSSHV